MVRERPCSRPGAEKKLKPEILGSLWGPLCALHGTWAFVSRPLSPFWHLGTEKQVQEGAESTGVMGRRGQERSVTLDGAPGSWLIPLAQTSRRTGLEPRNQRLVLAWLVRDKEAVASLFPVTAPPPPPIPPHPHPTPSLFSDGEGTSASGRRCKCESLLEEAM